MDFADPPRVIRAGLVAGRGHYDTVIRAVMEASRSIWISTANLKELRVDPPRGTRAHARGEFVSVLEVFAQLADRGVEIRILHAGLPSRAFARELVRRRDLVRPGTHGSAPALALRRCPRVHFKTVVVDGSRVYLGSANWTGAGLGAKGAGRRNFEVGFVIADNELLIASSSCTSVSGPAVSVARARCGILAPAPWTWQRQVAGAAASRRPREAGAGLARATASRRRFPRPGRPAFAG